MYGIQANKKRPLDSTDVKEPDSKRTKSSEKGKCTKTISNTCKYIVIFKYAIWYNCCRILSTGSSVCLIICLTVRTLPDTEEVQSQSEDILYQHLSDEVIVALEGSLSEEFCTIVKLTNIRKGSIKMDMSIEDLSRLEYIKYLSDKGVLSDIIDCFLMTPDFISKCQAQDVAVEAVIDEESYSRLKNQSGK